MGRTRTAVPALVTSALAVAALAMGCGSSPKPLTRAQLTSRANAICRRVAVKIEAANKGGEVNTPQQLERLTAKLAGFEQTALVELGQLVPPPALEADWKSFVAGAQTLAEDTAKIGQYVTTKNTAAGKQVISSAESTQKQMAAIAKRNGFKACEQVP
ncbi:MAG TPA: hypothetical protein VGY30_01555 [Solirubrobacteraceae bacterium]|jgi:hypothetical protein|nr:hypothetical protein [Solirubrobacteraceae bacterium]